MAETFDLAGAYHGQKSAVARPRCGGRFVRARTLARLIPVLTLGAAAACARGRAPSPPAPVASESSERTAAAVPPYADAAAFVERDAEIGSSPGLPGTLTVPKAARAVPGIVLVHGSGPQDRDETLGGTRLFRDLAFGLATRGIAVLRYDKRTRVDPRGVVTQKEEVVDGALAAIALLRSQPEVDPRRVVVLGHSQGGALAPRIAQADGRVAGVIVAAGPTRPLQDSLAFQLNYLLSIDAGNMQLRKLVEEATEFKRAVEDPVLRPDSDVHVPGDGHLKGAYFLDVRGFRPEVVAAALPCPVLVLQGGRDYQVTQAEDFEGWRHALSNHSNATLKSYPELDHRLVAGEGRSSPAGYQEEAHVDARVVEEVAAWTRALAPRP
jgi:dienelactone hydrolase